MRHTSCTVGMDPNTSDDLPQGKLADIEHAPHVPGPAAAERCEPVWSRVSGTRSHRDERAGPTYTLGGHGFRSPGALGCVAAEGAAAFYRGRRPHFLST